MEIFKCEQCNKKVNEIPKRNRIEEIKRYGRPMDRLTERRNRKYNLCKECYLTNKKRTNIR